MKISELLSFALAQGASDVHLSAELPAIIRVDGDLHRLNARAVDKAIISEFLYAVMTDEQRQHFEKYLDIDFAFTMPGVSRFRVNAYYQDRGLSAAFRMIPDVIKTLEDLNVSEILKQLANKSQGLILVTGGTGSGKSTTVAAMINYINENFSKHIISIEDPIEYIHNSKRCLIHQREVYRDTPSFSQALKAALRQDPDILLVGEMRDSGTIRLALTAAETGHLVFATLHTRSAAKTIHRILDVFPAGEKEMVRSMLASSLEAVIAQQLIKRIEKGRVAAFEVMLCNAAIRNLIREDKITQIDSCIQTGQAQGMMTLDQHLKILMQQQLIHA